MTFLPAFTVLEMLIVMLLSGIVIGLTYLYFTRFQHYIKQVSSTSEKYVNLGELITVFQKDIDDAEEIYFRAPYTLRLIEGKEETEYEFSGDGIIRKLELVNDTFHLRTTNLDIFELQGHNNLVEYIEFDLQVRDDPIQHASFLKAYNAKTLFSFYKSN